MPSRPDPLRETSRAPSRRVGRPAGPTVQGAASRDRIIAAAAAVFARLGYDRARMADIIDASGMSKGSVYFHFDSKEALAVAVLEDRHGRWIADVERALAKAPKGEPRIRELLPAMLDLHRRNPDAWVVSRLTQNLADVGSTRPLAASMTQKWIDMVADLIREAAPEPRQDSPVDATTLATVLVAAFDGLKLTSDTVSSGDKVAAGRRLVEAGKVLEQMLFHEIGLRPSEPNDTSPGS